jgi:hypothetical protein
VSPFRIPILLMGVVLPVAAAHADTGPGAHPASRYAVTATLVPTPASADGRYRVDADLRVAASVQSTDGRYRVKAVAASCDPADDRLFANGFETP